MTTMFILVKDTEIVHTYSKALREKNINDGWIWRATISGFNMSVSYKSIE